MYVHGKLLLIGFYNIFYFYFLFCYRLIGFYSVVFFLQTEISGVNIKTRRDFFC